MPNDLSQLFLELPENFRTSERCQSALTHKSYYFEVKNSPPHNERLEFLGDAALGLFVAELLFVHFPDRDEGFLTRARANLVNTKTLWRKAVELKLDEHVKAGKSESTLPPRVMASVLEALLGALYLELGDGSVRSFLKELFKEELNSEEKLIFSDSDWKSKLQEDLQKEFQKTPTYEVISAEGLDHQKSFEVRVMFEGEVLGIGSGSSRKQAEQEAAKDAVYKRGGENSGEKQ